MNTAIVAEYNPFHKGHLYHINKTREKGSDNIIAIMSGNFVQRGEPALLNKHIRTKMALLNGVDMVLELPVEYATSGADVFAFGACDIIKKSGIIDSISFGCENDSTEIFIKIARLLNNETKEFKEHIKAFLSKGMSYPQSRALAINKCLNIDTEFLNNSNNILALEYIRNIVDTDIKPIAIERIVSKYNDTNMTGDISSATAIREAIKNKNIEALNSVPENVSSILRDIKKVPDIDDYSAILSYIIRTKGTEINKYADVTEGLENRIIAMNNNQNITGLIEDIKSKRYTYSKIKRALLHIILEIKKEEQKRDIKYIRVLGVKKDKVKLLSLLNEKSYVPVVIKVAENKDMLINEIRATDIYNILSNKGVGQEYREPVVIE